MAGIGSWLPAPARKWFAFGSGVGIEIIGPYGAESLRVAAVNVNPRRARVLGTLKIEAAGAQAAAVWGAEYAAFARKHGVSHVPATVLLSRRDVIVRHLMLPGVSDKDLPAAVEFQMEGLHPYPETEAVSSWSRIPGTAFVLVVIARRSVIERFTALFAEAGIKVGAFTCSAAAIYSALRFSRPGLASTSGLLAYEPTPSGVEIYGESASRPAFSAAFDLPVERAAALASAELRLDSGTPLQSLEDLLKAAPALPYSAALASAAPVLGLPLNLLPAELRETGSRAGWIVSATLACAVLLLAIAWAEFPRYQESQYLAGLQREIQKVSPAANRSAALDREIETARRRTLLLDQFRARTKSDMEVLRELTRILPPPSWLNLLEITRTQVTLAGETQQAAPLLQTIDSSPLFQDSQFAMPPSRVNNAEVFRIRATREGAEK
jgi:hypothetical protein